MVHNKYACELPVSVAVTGSVYSFTYLDCRQTGRQVVRSILQAYACEYLAKLGLTEYLMPTCFPKLTFAFSGSTLTVTLPLAVGSLLYLSQELTYNGASLTYVESN